MGEPFVGLSDAALEAHLGERAARLGRQIYHRIQLRRIEHVAMMVKSGIGIAILSEASVKDMGHLGLAIVPLRDPWALRQLHLCARDFSALTPHAGLLAQQLMEPKAPNSESALRQKRTTRLKLVGARDESTAVDDDGLAGNE